MVLSAPGALLAAQVTMLNSEAGRRQHHRLKARNGFVEVYVIPVIQFAEDLAKFNWSKIAKGICQLRRRSLSL
jgi:hypothetical protein